MAQRERALALGYDLIEWTFDPLQAMNAHLNMTKLGCVAEEYHRNVYGESTSALHKGTPTDRLVAQWHIARAACRAAHRLRVRTFAFRAREVAERADGEPDRHGRRLADVRQHRPDLDGRRVWLEIPTGSPTCSMQAPELALAWRHAHAGHLRDLLRTRLQGRGLRAQSIIEGFGRYLLAREVD